MPVASRPVHVRWRRSNEVRAAVTPIRKRLVMVVLALGVLVSGLVWWVRADAVPDVTVHGQVTVDGEPLPDGLVIFYPDSGRGNRSPVEPRARTDRRGRYQLRAEGKQGITPGWYRVAVVVHQPEPGGGLTARSKDSVRSDRRYENPNTSGLTVLVRPHSPRGGYDFDLARQRPGK